MSWGKRLIWTVVGTALVGISVFSTNNYANNHNTYVSSGGHQLAMAAADLNDTTKKFALVYPQLTGQSLNEAYVDVINARIQLNEAMSSLDSAVEKANAGLELSSKNGFNNEMANDGLDGILSAKKTVTSILGSLPTDGSKYHGGKEQALLVEANTAAVRAEEILSKAPSGANCKVWGYTAIGNGILGLFALLTGTVFYKGLARWYSEENAKKNASS